MSNELLNKGLESKSTQVETTRAFLEKNFGSEIGEDPKLTIENLEVFNDYLNNLKDTKSDFYDMNLYNKIISKINTRKDTFLDLIYDNGFPNNETISFFVDIELSEIKSDDNFNEGIENNNEGIENNNEGIENNNEGTKNRNGLKKKRNEGIKKRNKGIENNNEGIEKVIQNSFTQEIIDQFSDSSVFQNALQSLFDGKNIEANSEILIKSLEEDEFLLYKVLDLLKNEDHKKYESFKTYLIDKSPKLVNYIQIYENSPKMEMISTVTDIKSSFDQAIITASLGTDIEEDIVSNGSRKEAIDKEGDSVFVDTSEVPPLRQIALNGSNYKMETEVTVGDFYEATVDYEVKKKALVKKETELNGIIEQSTNKLNEINSKIEDLKRIEEITGNLSDEDKTLKDKLIIEKQKEENIIIENKSKLKIIHKDFSKLEEQYKVDLKSKVKGYSDKLKEKDKEKKMILKFLNNTGFDLIPQTLTNQIIREIQGNVFDIKGLNLNPKTLDLSNGMFGESPTEIGGNKWKDNLVKFLEKMLYGEIGGKNSIFNGKEFKGQLGAKINSLDFNKALEDSRIKTGTGWNINVIRNNLKKETK